eukprot:TRINITY_DN9156_c0_g1_i1.p1 TRINITY_DN9156_c0_g1~~TRINITY_DN9156_c0_g1_i1.p1  ORF type:complete len:480 (-),score=108.79 TRINITY_DN9156_c0_g1_i1:111-1550(-)
MGAALVVGECCATRDQRQTSEQADCASEPRKVWEFSFVSGGWMQRDAFKVSAAVAALSDHPGQYRELFICRDLPMVSSGGQSLKVDCSVLGENDAKALAKVLQRDRALQVLLLQGVAMSDCAAAHLATALVGRNAVALRELSFLGMNLQGDFETCLARVLRSSGWLELLSLSGSRMSHGGMTQLFGALRCSLSVRALGLDGVSLGDPGAALLAEALAGNKALTDVALSRNGIGDVGAQALAAAVKQSEVLAKLDLRENCIGDVGARALDAAVRKPRDSEDAVRLDLRGNQVTAAGMIELESRARESEVAPSSPRRRLLLRDNLASEVFVNAHGDGASDEELRCCPSSTAETGTKTDVAECLNFGDDNSPAVKAPPAPQWLLPFSPRDAWAVAMGSPRPPQVKPMAVGQPPRERLSFPREARPPVHRPGDIGTALGARSPPPLIRALEMRAQPASFGVEAPGLTHERPWKSFGTATAVQG